MWYLENIFLGQYYEKSGLVYMLVVNSIIGCFKFYSQLGKFKHLILSGLMMADKLRNEG